MNDNYNDRGIIKWLPFDGLAGFHDLLVDLKYRLDKVDMPVLLDDKLTDMNRLIKVAINFKKSIYIKYYNNGYFIESFGSIISINLIKNTILLSDHSTYELSRIVDLAISD